MPFRSIPPTSDALGQEVASLREDLGRVAGDLRELRVGLRSLVERVNAIGALHFDDRLSELAARLNALDRESAAAARAQASDEPDQRGNGQIVPGCEPRE